MMETVASSTIQNRAVCNIFPIVDKDSPDLHEEEKRQVCEFLQREDEWENVVGNRLHPAVNRVESD